MEPKENESVVQDNSDGKVCAVRVPSAMYERITNVMKSESMKESVAIRHILNEGLPIVESHICERDKKTKII